MIRQTLAILLDAYRDLNARKLFWITLGLSALFVAAFGLLGIEPHGMKFATLRWGVQFPTVVYKVIFSTVVIGVWLTWIAAVLALVSTAGIFPDFVAGGAIDLYLSKPIGRFRMFLTKYVSGLLFVTIQVLLVAIGSYLIMGLRIGEWNASLFLTVPIVVCFFSYLFAICVAFGMLTRSTIAALLLTILCWAVFASLDRAEPLLLFWRHSNEAQAQRHERDADLAEKNLRQAEPNPKAASLLPSLREQAATAQREADDSRRWARNAHIAHGIVYTVKLVTPKTSDTTNLLDRYIFSRGREADAAAGVGDDQGGDSPPDAQGARMEGARQTVEEVRSRSPAWIIGTSLGFEAVIVGWAGWLFCRRDY